MAKNPMVLLIDPDPTGRAELHRTLALMGVAIVGESGYGIEAFSLAREAHPDVVVLAMEEPIIRPLQTIREISEAYPHLPVIVYSSLKDPNIMRKAMQIGVRDFLTKPFKNDELLQSISKTIKQGHDWLPFGHDQPVTVSPHGTIITVFGAKGGIGKTIIATNTAVNLAKNDEATVALVDLDTRFGDVALMMDINAENNISALAMPEDEIDRDVIRGLLHPHSSGVMILSAPKHPEEWRNLSPAHIEKAIQLLSEMFDYVVVDTPGAFNEIIYSALQISTIVLMVTSGDLPSLKDSFLSLELMEKWGFSYDKVKVILNNANGPNIIKQSDMKSLLGRELFWELPYDRRVSASTQLGKPVVIVHPKSQIARVLTDLSNALSSISKTRRGKGRILGRFFAPMRSRPSTQEEMDREHTNA